ncbi:hypothetical protein SAMN03080594_101810 [Arenibacter palladensis]|uniref:Uncharacterized protein n=1 Tax=Arenibacter palladensis TaxID=237373 RepID=A0A1M4V1K0_9FLAO|nr:hypothetical protein SAMN03080594_101810 [Arenibacter palladensis]
MLEKVLLILLDKELFFLGMKCVLLGLMGIIILNYIFSLLK